MQRKNIILWFRTNKTTSRKTKTKEHLETNSKQNKNKKQEPEIDMRNRKEGRKKEKNKRETKKEKVKKGEAQKKAKEEQRETQKNKKCPFRGKTGFFYWKQREESKENTQKKQKISRVWGQVRWPFGPPHLTLKPSKKNQKTQELNKNNTKTSQQKNKNK